MKEFLVIMHPSDNLPLDLPYVVQSKSTEEINKYISQNSNIPHSIIDLDVEEIETFKLIRNELYIVQDQPEKDAKAIEGIYRVQKVTYSIHKKNGEKILKASYNFKSEKGWVWTSLFLSFDKTGYPRTKAFEWLNARIPKNPDINVNNANINTEMVYTMTDIFETPKQVQIEMNEQGYPQVVAEIWGY